MSFTLFGCGAYFGCFGFRRRFGRLGFGCGSSFLRRFFLRGFGGSELFVGGRDDYFPAASAFDRYAVNRGFFDLGAVDADGADGLRA